MTSNRLALCCLCASLACLASATEPLRMPAGLPELEQRGSWQQSLDELATLGVPRSWLIAGPVPEQKYKQFESVMQPDRSDDWSALKTVRWERPAEETGCEVDLGYILGASRDVLAWAQTEVEWPVDGPALAWFDSPARAALFVNNERKCDTPEAQKKRALEDKDALFPIPVQMNRGRNVIKVKCARSGDRRGPFGFSLRLERNDLNHRVTLLNKLRELYPEEAAGWRGREALLEIARQYERAGRMADALAAYKKASDAGSGSEDCAAEAQRRLAQRPAEERAGEKWQAAEQRFMELLAAAETLAADRVMSEFAARFPLHETAGMALAYRGALRLDYGLAESSRPFFERALREYSIHEPARKLALHGLACVRQFRPEAAEVDVNHEIQAQVEGAQRQMNSSLPEDMEAALKSLDAIVRTSPEAMLRLSDSPLTPRYAGMREYTRALLAHLGGETLARYRQAAAPLAEARLKDARAMGSPFDLETMACEFYYTPAAARALNHAGNIHLDRGAWPQAAAAFRALLRDFRADGAALQGGIAAPAVSAKLTRAQARENAELPDTGTFAANTRRNGAGLESPAPLPGNFAWAQAALPSYSMDLAREFRRDDTNYSPVQPFPAVAGDRVFVTTLEGVQALDLNSGQSLWRLGWKSRGGLLFRSNGEPLFSGFPASCPTAQGGRVFLRVLNGSQSALRCHDAETGRLVWSTEPQASFRSCVFLSNPLVAYGLCIAVYLETPPAGEDPALAAINTHGVAAFDAESGELRWKRGLARGVAGMKVCEKQEERRRIYAYYRGSLQLGPPAADGGVVYAATGLGSIAALNAVTGEVAWLSGYPRLKSEDMRMGTSAAASFSPRLQKLNARGPASPIVAGDVVVMAPKDAAGVFGFDRASGRVRWAQELLDARFLAGVCDGNVLAADSAVTAISAASGKIAWEYSLQGKRLLGQPGYSGSVLYLPTSDNLLLVDARAGKPIGSFKWDGRTGALANLVVTANRIVGVNSKVTAALSAAGSAVRP